MSSLLVTNDFPPKTGGIQSYLYELWRRLPPDETTVLTTSFEGASAFDAAQTFRIERARQRVFLPTPALGRHVDALAREVDATVIFIDPMLPLGFMAPRLRSAPWATRSRCPAGFPAPARRRGACCEARRASSPPGAIPHGKRRALPVCRCEGS